MGCDAPPLCPLSSSFPVKVRGRLWVSPIEGVGMGGRGCLLGAWIYTYDSVIPAHMLQISFSYPTTTDSVTLKPCFCHSAMLNS